LRCDGRVVGRDRSDDPDHVAFEIDRDERPPSVFPGRANAVDELLGLGKGTQCVLSAEIVRRFTVR
jgi:hypothetical protein